MFITKAVENDLQTILELQYLAYHQEKPISSELKFVFLEKL